MTQYQTAFIFICVMFSAGAWSTSEDARLEKQKQAVMQDVRKTCTPSSAMAQEEWEKKILDSEHNRNHIREATLAMERNNAKAYWQAISQIECLEY
nr:YicS family protein [uncultured Enterobacter sp.]